MAIEDIFKALEEQAEAECDQIRRAAEAQAKAIKAEAKQEAERIKEQRLKAVNEVVETKTGKTLNAARLDVKKALAAVRESTVEAVFEDAQKKLAALRSSKEYEDVFTRLVQEAVKNVDGECVLLVDPADKAVAEKVVGTLGMSCEVDPSIETIGGVVVSSDGGRVNRRNTFESRLEKAKGIAQAKIAEILTQ
ncbi:MAG: hypothetical protein Kow0067_05830 [Coriobacteriia bacterium]